MNGQAIGSQPLASASLRQWPTEAVGPRPGGVRGAEVEAAEAGGRSAGAAAERRRAAATRP